ncbi:Cys-tRNA(Pro) deacylase [Vagococcus sp. BWB3-3]|uniref:Cys-tRNA(Pro)/Cys-tRNA(Cys) deacylase n=1 Tax=Vagococcus allomyrinae TaxID=2794353 RepID=A0A940PFB9_9ENTE|nr:Cys-tRNA(Pro) deacylase [Vagococcus allomyrinae]
MAKKKIQKTNAIRIVEQHKIPYTEREYQWSEDHIDAVTAAHNLGMAVDAVFKTLLTVGNKTGPVVAVIPGNQELDLKSLAKVSGNKKVEMLPLKELEQTTGYIRGGCSPIGMKKLFPTYIDKLALEKGIIHVSAGKRGLQLGIAAEDLANLVKGEFAELSVK